MPACLPGRAAGGGKRPLFFLLFLGIFLLLEIAPHAGFFSHTTRGYHVRHTRVKKI